MPPGGRHLTRPDVQVVHDWIKQGAKNNQVGMTRLFKAPTLCAL
jgi:hypothetical protein